MKAAATWRTALAFLAGGAAPSFAGPTRPGESSFENGGALQ